ncbi:hypothetical protein CALVIDRAFT_155095 [Calocera viscosa TUFC12733]|uniref:TLC domain-containing protein n=1 Tax=Calocera viscosa (strain TUFC12733) TaxID=1330018 RepID=A0A167LP14_CALVF|nr:hypothetical protein CALVIDRAFT_155095 [Calocera viscosa TUFC12733]
MPLILRSFIVFNLTNALSSFLSPYVSKIYPTLPRKTKHAWDVRFTATLFASTISYLAWLVLDKPGLQDRAFGWDPEAGVLLSIACGYFAWDVFESITWYEDPGYLAHAIACLIIFGASFRPFLAYYAARFLLWEISTPFLHIHWWLDKTKQTGGTYQFVNGAILMTLFMAVRLIYGGYQSTQFWRTLGEIRDKVPLPMLVIYGVGNIFLQGLNWYWFYKMIAAMRKRFPAKDIAEKKQ